MDIFSDVYYGNTIENWLISLSIIVGAVILNRITSYNVCYTKLLRV